MRINNKLGKVFPPAMRFAGYIILSVGLIFLFVIPLAGFIILLFAGLLAFSYAGILVEPERGRFKSYGFYLGFKFGDWESLEAYPYISILQKNIRTTAYSQSNRSTSINDTFFDVYLLSENHRKKVLLFRSAIKEQSENEMKNISKLLGKQYQMYQPK